MLTIVIDEEYGFRTWLWHTGMTSSELISFWESIEKIEFRFPIIDELPGSLELIQSHDLNDDCNGTESDALRAVQNHRYVAHIHEDHDSSLYDRYLDETYLHKGFKYED